ncbi:gag-pol [Trichonephila clavipes]|nr:gag-pol [Trichonephila clavipes]
MKPVAEIAISSEELVNADAPCESSWIEVIEKLREEIQDLIAQRQNLRKRRITCWGCGGAGYLRSRCPRINKEDHNINCWGCGRIGHVRSNCPRVNQEDPCRTNRKSCLENSKYCSRVGKKFGARESIVRQVTTPSTSSLDPWKDESVKKDQLADPEIKPIIESKESSDEKTSCISATNLLYCGWYELIAMRKHEIKCSSVKHDRCLVFMAFMAEKADSQRYVDPNTGTWLCHFGRVVETTNYCVSAAGSERPATERTNTVESCSDDGSVAEQRTKREGVDTESFHNVMPSAGK